MSDDKPDPLDVPAAKCGKGRIDGAVWRPGDPVKHLGPPYEMVARQSPAFYSSKLFSTRCGLGPDRDNPWRRQGDWGDGGPFGSGSLWGDDDDYWCPACLDQAMIPYELWTDD